MVFGFGIAVTIVPLVNQCAETTTTALGVGISFPICCQRFENSLSSIAFIGEPCPMNKTGSFSSSSCNDLDQLYKGLIDAIAAPPEIIFIKSLRFIFNICIYKCIDKILIKKHLMKILRKQLYFKITKYKNNCQ